MKKYIWHFVLLVLFSMSAISSDFDLAIRNIKLANSYRESGDYNNAIKYLNIAHKQLDKKSGWEAKYWSYAADEYLGFVYRDMKMQDEAKKYFSRALAGYKALVKQKDGSPIPVENLLAESEKISSIIAGLGNSKSNSKILNFDKMKLKSLPNDINSDVENLSMADNKFKEFPAFNDSFNKLTHLNLSSNRIVALDMRIASLKNLVWLNLSNNRIKKIEQGIEMLSKLEVLDLSNNKLKDIPASISSLKNLKVLNLKGNKINFNKIKSLIQAMPKTNILHDEYILKPNEEEQIED